MAFDESVAHRLRELLQGCGGVTEKKMFGGLAFMSQGHMFAGVLGSCLMARVGPANYAAALALPDVREMDFTGRPMKGYVFVEPPGFASDADLQRWVNSCLAFVAKLPPKKPK
jgi:hypothetical protein